jgi:hypothetical protein
MFKIKLLVAVQMLLKIFVIGASCAMVFIASRSWRQEPELEDSIN